VLGIDDHTCLDLPDGGLAAIKFETGVATVGAVIERVGPDTILTFGPDGITGHPDHIAIGDWAAEAAATVLGDQCRVLAATKTSEWLDAFAHVNEGILTTPPPCTSVDEIALEVRLTTVELETKMRALAAQPSQTSGLMTALGDATYRAWLATEYWMQRR
jgi:LmbE family N-acetylglucosaminyl deacetylase